MKLLSLGSTNAKTKKSDSIQDKYLTAILYLAPYTTAGRKNVCPKSSEGCRKACLFTAGRGAFSNVMNARLRRTNEYFDDNKGFIAQLESDIAKFEKKCEKQGKKACVRLNGTSDILWERTGIFEKFPNVQFYDYTKIAKRFYSPLPANYHLTFSLHEDNRADAEKILQLGLGNVAVVFKNELPKQFMGKKVVNGDLHDLRFIDKTNVVVGLIAKGKARKDETGFVI